jgi:hypothetical protein
MRADLPQGTKSPPKKSCSPSYSCYAWGSMTRLSFWTLKPTQYLHHIVGDLERYLVYASLFVVRHVINQAFGVHCWCNRRVVRYRPTFAHMWHQGPALVETKRGVKLVYQLHLLFVKRLLAAV